MEQDTHLVHSSRRTQLVSHRTHTRQTHSLAGTACDGTLLQEGSWSCYKCVAEIIHSTISTFHFQL